MTFDARMRRRVALRLARHLDESLHDVAERIGRWLMRYEFRCLDCGIDIGGADYYMVHDDVWAESGLGKDDGMLCRRCLAQRLGRRLTPDDFTDAVVNVLHGDARPAFDDSWRSGGT
jgi:hypothetical protein